MLVVIATHGLAFFMGVLLSNVVMTLVKRLGKNVEEM